LLFALVVQGIRISVSGGRRQGLLLARAIPAIACHDRCPPDSPALVFQFPPAWADDLVSHSEGNVARARVLARLNAMEGKQHRDVRYARYNAAMNEWVVQSRRHRRRKSRLARTWTQPTTRAIAVLHDRHAWLVKPMSSTKDYVPIRSSRGILACGPSLLQEEQQQGKNACATLSLECRKSL